MKFIQIILRAEYIVDVYRKDKGSETGFADPEIKHNMEKMHKAKSVLKALIEQLCNEDKDHKVFEGLAHADADDLVDVENVTAYVDSILCISSFDHTCLSQ